MEWVEVTGKTMEEAVEAALDQLGVDESEAEIEVLEEAKGGLFGLLRSEARVRARVAPAAARPKVERRERRPRTRTAATPDSSTPAAPAASSPTTPSTRTKRAPKAPAPEPTAGGSTMTEISDSTQPNATARPSAPAESRPTVEVAEEFLEGLLDAFGLVGTLERLPVDEDSVELAVVGDDLGLLIGPKGQTLAAVQELTRAVIQRRGEPSGTRIFVDVAGYRQARRAALDRFTRQAAQQVLDSGITRVLEPMPAADRKVVHDTVNTLSGLVTMSEGEDPHRRVVIMVEPEQDQG